MYHILFIHSSVGEHLGCFYLLAFLNNSSVSIGVLSVQVPLFISRSGITGSYGNPMFSFLRDRWTVFHNGCTILHSYKQWMKVPVSPPPGQHLLLYFFHNSHHRRYEVVSHCHFGTCIFLTYSHLLKYQKGRGGGNVTLSLKKWKQYDSRLRPSPVLHVFNDRGTGYRAAVMRGEGGGSQGQGEPEPR